MWQEEIVICVKKRRTKGPEGLRVVRRGRRKYVVVPPEAFAPTPKRAPYDWAKDPDRKADMGEG